MTTPTPRPFPDLDAMQQTIEYGLVRGLALYPDVSETLAVIVAYREALARLAAAEAAIRRDTIAEVVMLLDREASTRFDQFLSYELASSDGAAALRDAIQKVRALLPAEGQS